MLLSPENGSILRPGLRDPPPQDPRKRPCSQWRPSAQALSQGVRRGCAVDGLGQTACHYIPAVSTMVVRMAQISFKIRRRADICWTAIGRHPERKVRSATPSNLVGNQGVSQRCLRHLGQPWRPGWRTLQRGASAKKMRQTVLSFAYCLCKRCLQQLLIRASSTTATAAATTGTTTISKARFR